jgi:PAS domain S-box-containing protein
MTVPKRVSTSQSLTPPDPAALIARLERRLARERNAREQAEMLLESKSAELFDAARRLERESARATALLSAIEASSDGIALTDGDGIFTYMNAAHASMFGYTADELTGQPWSVLYTPDVATTFQRYIMPIVFSAGNWRGEVEGLSRSGQPVSQEVVLTRRGQGGIVCATRDISERLTREREARELEARLLKAEREAALFTIGNAVAHDFNNLIAAISGYALLLQSDLEAGSAAHGRASRILEAAEQASDVIRSLEVARTNDVHAIEEIDLVKLLRTGLAITDAIRPGGIRVEVELPEQAIVQSNETLLSRALVNIVKNAFEAMVPEGTLVVRLSDTVSRPFGGESHRFRLGDQGRQSARVLELIDTGPGIPPDRLEKVFSPFTTTKASMRGSGLGLLSLKALADTQSASVEVETREGMGTCFRVLFPDPRGPRQVSDQPLAPKRPRGDDRTRVLIVDDNRSVGQMLAETLARRNFIAEHEADPLAALERIRSHGFDHDVLLTDLTMPQMAGDELARQAKLAVPQLPIVLYSGQAGYVPRDPIYADVLTKPISPERLVSAIEHAVSSQAWRSMIGL